MSMMTIPTNTKISAAFYLKLFFALYHVIHALLLDCGKTESSVANQLRPKIYLCADIIINQFHITTAIVVENI